jgi:hypothetical protein
MLAHTYSPSSQEVEVGGMKVQAQPVLHNKILSLKKKTKQKELISLGPFETGFSSQCARVLGCIHIPNLKSHFVFKVLRIEPRALCMVGECSPTQLHPQLTVSLLFFFSTMGYH